MNREEFYNESNKVLTDAEYNVIYGAFSSAEDSINDVMDNLREAVKGVMAKLWEKRTSTELVTDSFTIINRFGDITIIEGDDVEGETSLDNINDVDTMLDIVSEII